MLAMVRWTALDEPWPISIMAMTAATPMTMPSVVRAARRTLRRRPPRAVWRVPLNRPAGSPAPDRSSRQAYGGARWHNLGLGGSGIGAFRFDPTVPDPDNASGVASHFRIVGNEKDGDAFFLIEPLEYP